MKNFFFLFTIALLFSCNHSKPRIEVVEDENLTQVEIDSIIDQYTFKYDRLTFIDSTDIVLFPITTQNHSGKRFNKSIYSSTDYADHWNILFYNSITSKTNLLTENKINIINFKTNIKEVDSTLESSILYEIINTDYNKDQEIDYKDPTYLFISKNTKSVFCKKLPLSSLIIKNLFLPTFVKPSKLSIFQPSFVSNEASIV